MRLRNCIKKLSRPDRIANEDAEAEIQDGFKEYCAIYILIKKELIQRAGQDLNYLVLAYIRNFILASVLQY